MALLGIIGWLQKYFLELAEAISFEKTSQIPLPSAPSFLNSRLLSYVTVGHTEPSFNYLGSWEPKGRV